MAIIDKMIKRENYLIFSITKVKLLDEYKNEKVVGYGILGKVYLTNDFYEKVSRNNRLIIIFFSSFFLFFQNFRIFTDFKTFLKKSSTHTHIFFLNNEKNKNKRCLNLKYFLHF